MTTATAAPSVSDLAAQYAATASASELVVIARSKRGFITSHGTGLLTTEEMRAIYRNYVQQGTARQALEMFALAQAVAEAVQEVPYGSLSSWAQRQARKVVVCTSCGRKGTKRSPLLHGRHGYAHNACDH